MKLRFLFCFVLLFLLSICNAQERFTIELTRKVLPKVAYDTHMVKLYYSPLRWRKNTDSTFRLIDNYDLIAGDFSDGHTKFSIAINQKNRAAGFPLYIFPYRSDSVIINQGVNEASAEPGKVICLQAYGKEYGAILNSDNNAITLFRLTGEYEKPDARIYDSLMPDYKFTLINGQKDVFSHYKHHNKYIFVMFWNTWQPGDTRQVDELKLISDSYKDALTILSFHRDTLAVTQVEKEKNIDWIEAKSNDDIEGLFPAGRASAGILFSSEGKAIEFNLAPDELKPVIEKLLHVTN